MKIDNIRENNLKIKLENELNYLTCNGKMNLFNNYQEIDIEGRIEMLKLLVASKNVNTAKETSIKQKKQEIFDEMNKYVYKKQWNKLNNIHKIIKIKEYVEEKYINVTKKQKELIIQSLVSRIDAGTFNTKRYVIYDPSAEKILNIPALVVDIDKNTVEIKV